MAVGSLGIIHKVLGTGPLCIEFIARNVSDLRTDHLALNQEIGKGTGNYSDGG